MKALVALLIGLAIGGVLTWIRLPVPAPSSLEGVAGLVGLYLGYVVVSLIWR